MWHTILHTMSDHVATAGGVALGFVWAHSVCVRYVTVYTSLFPLLNRAEAPSFRGSVIALKRRRVQQQLPKQTVHLCKASSSNSSRCRQGAVSPAQRCRGRCRSTRCWPCVTGQVRHCGSSWQILQLLLWRPVGGGCPASHAATPWRVKSSWCRRLHQRNGCGHAAALTAAPHGRCLHVTGASSARDSRRLPVMMVMMMTMTWETCVLWSACECHA